MCTRFIRAKITHFVQHSNPTGHWRKYARTGLYLVGSPIRTIHVPFILTVLVLQLKYHIPEPQGN